MIKKMNIQKSVTLPYTNNRISEKEIKETIPFIITSERIQYVGINLPKDAKDLSSENYKMLLKGTRDNTNRWKDIPYSLTERVNIVKFSDYPRESTDSMQSLS